MTPVDVSKAAAAQLLVQVELLLRQLPLILWEGRRQAGFVLMKETSGEGWTLSFLFQRSERNVRLTRLQGAPSVAPLARLLVQ